MAGDDAGEGSPSNAGDRDTDADASGAFLGDIDPEAVTDGAALSLTPEQHQRLKDGLHGSRFDDLRRADRRYLVVGSGSGEQGQRRRRVCARLDDRRDAVGFRLEAFGFDADDLDLWAPAFEVLSAQATQIVGVIEDFDGGHVWELGYLYRQQATVRDALWLLKRVYDDPTDERARYDNGMAASHLAALEAAVADRVLEWATVAELDQVTDQIP